MKRTVLTGLTVMLLLSGCAKALPPQRPAAPTPAQPTAAPAQPATAPAQPTTAPAAPTIEPPEDGAAAAQQLSSNQVLNRASFEGGTFRDHAFHGGQVLLWQPEPNRYRLRASLDLGGGQWRSTANTHDVAFDPTAFFASVASLNDVVQVERAVPLWAFFGHVANPEIALVEVLIPGIQLPPADVKRGTWLLVCQGVLHTGPSQIAEVITYDASRKEINRTTIKLP